mmetsp:Transcript_24841/g.52901  ORF Transcript_24841/g.52901 Transcript_24841/m.52901 type:complete len:500 (+) Transcript_24841:181-1680(+)
MEWQTTLIGRGGMSEVYLVERNGARYVLKAGPTEDLQTMARDEYDLLRTLSHPHILETVAMRDGPHAGEPLYKYCEGGDLQQVIKKYRIREIQYFTFANQIALALEYLHEEGIIHCDIKPQNVFLDQRGDKWEAVLGDFGLSFFEGDTTGFGRRGTKQFWAPEVDRGERPTFKSDMWSYGQTFPKRLWGAVDSDGTTRCVDSAARDNLTRLLRMCTEWVDTERPNASEIVHVFREFFAQGLPAATTMEAPPTATAAATAAGSGQQSHPVALDGAALAEVLASPDAGAGAPSPIAVAAPPTAGRAIALPFRLAPAGRRPRQEVDWDSRGVVEAALARAARRTRAGPGANGRMWRRGDASPGDALQGDDDAPSEHTVLPYEEQNSRPMNEMTNIEIQELRRRQAARRQWREAAASGWWRYEGANYNRHRGGWWHQPTNRWWWREADNYHWQGWWRNQTGAWNDEVGRQQEAHQHHISNEHSNWWGSPQEVEYWVKHSKQQY